jgi:hypothetical protein
MQIENIIIYDILHKNLGIGHIRNVALKKFGNVFPLGFGRIDGMKQLRNWTAASFQGGRLYAP